LGRSAKNGARENKKKARRGKAKERSLLAQSFSPFFAPPFPRAASQLTERLEEAS